MKKTNQYIMGIGHRVKSLENPDSRVTVVKDFVRTQFPKSPLFGIVHRMFSRNLNQRILEIIFVLLFYKVDIFDYSSN